jgi:hypothetical protein
MHDALHFWFQCGVALQHERVMAGDDIFHFTVSQLGELVVTAQRVFDIDGDKERLSLLVVLIVVGNISCDHDGAVLGHDPHALEAF